jgi:hypothetical protein
MLLIIVTCVACFFGGRASRNEEVAQLNKELDPFTARTECVYSVAIVLRKVDGGLCEISVGSDDGLKPHARGTLSRGDNFLGFVTAERIAGERSIARLDLRNGVTVQKGDRVNFDFASR